MSRAHKIFFLIALLVVGVNLVIMLPSLAWKPAGVLLITVDSLRPDHLGCYGAAGGASPFIDSLAARGAVFERAFCQAPWTWTSLLSLASSTYPSRNGAYYWNVDLPRSLPTLASVFKSQGYATGLVTGHTELGRRGEWNRYFDTIDVPQPEFGAEKTAGALLARLDGLRGRKFFFWAHFMDIHMGSLSHSADYVRAYDEALLRIDGQVGRILQKLSELGVLEKTVIVFTADHGELLGREGKFGSHGWYLLDELIHVPLIVAGAPRLPGGARVASLAASVDIAPTLCELTGITAPEEFEGKSLVPAARGKAGAHEYVFSENKEFWEEKDTKTSNHKEAEWRFTRYSIRSDEWKLIYTKEPRSSEYQLFNIRTDPLEAQDLAKDKPEELAKMRGELEKWLARKGSTAGNAAGPAPLDEERKTRLQNLKYLQ